MLFLIEVQRMRDVGVGWRVEGGFVGLAAHRSGIQNRGKAGVLCRGVVGGRGFQNREKLGQRHRGGCGRHTSKGWRCLHDWFLWVVKPGVVGRTDGDFFN